MLPTTIALAPKVRVLKSKCVDSNIEQLTSHCVDLVFGKTVCAGIDIEVFVKFAHSVG